ncbi:MAG: PocR ligand-binding domain-containing protein [Oscillospiraceae bacterium]|nr:PocR ligand-binding domain-containing protein [Oscillospiraceae bacterium]
MLQLNTADLYHVLRDFHTLTRLRIVIFDGEFREVLSYPNLREDFCTRLRQTPEGDAACRESDMAGCKKCARTKQLVRYCCHAGLTEAVVPISDKSGVLAYVMFGQLIPQENGSQVKAALKHAFPALADAVEQLPMKSAAELQAAATVLQAITSYVIANRWVIPEKSEFIRQLDHYIETHLSQSIGIEELCAVFHIGRTKLYAISAEYLGCGLAEYIRIQRILHARQLLSHTDLPITDIAYAVGFSDYNHFSRIFKLLTGCNARAYRKANPVR